MLSFYFHKLSRSLFLNVGTESTTRSFSSFPPQLPGIHLNHASKDFNFNKLTLMFQDFAVSSLQKRIERNQL